MSQHELFVVVVVALKMLLLSSSLVLFHCVCSKFVTLIMVMRSSSVVLCDCFPCLMNSSRAGLVILLLP